MAITELEIKQLRKKYGIGSAPQSGSATAPVEERLQRLRASAGLPDNTNKIVNANNDSSAGQKISDGLGTFLKTGADLTINPIGKALSTPFVSLARGIQGLIPGGKSGNEVAQTPFGEVKPIASQTPKESLGNALEVGLQGVGAGLADDLFTSIGKRLSPVLKTKAQKIYQTALKPSQPLLKKAKTDVIQTGLDEGIKVSNKGFDKIQGIISSVGDDINRTIDNAAKAGKLVDSNELLNYATAGEEYFSNVIGAKKMASQWADDVLNGISELQSQYGQMIPVDKAQVIKRASQKYLSKYYDKIGPVEIEVKKQLTRGLKEGIQKAVPEIEKLNKREMALLELDPFLEKAVGRINNREAINAFDFLIATGGGLTGGSVTGNVTGQLSGAGILLGIKKFLQSPALKSQRAIWYNKLANNATEALKNGSYATTFAITRLLQELDDQSK